MSYRPQNTPRVRALCALLVAGWLWAGPAHAAPEEIQVYMDEFERPGEFGLDLHTNFVADAQAGAATSNMLRVTPELSYGLNDHWEAGLYYLTSTGPNQLQGAPVSDGFKVRFKWRPQAPSADSPWYTAVNFELGQLASRFYPDQTSSEVKLIGLWRSQGWTLASNLNFDQPVNPDAQQPYTTLEIDSRVSYRLRADGDHAMDLGLEHYAALGNVSNLYGSDLRTTTTFVVLDFSVPSGWDFDLGVGVASGATGDRLVLKAIFGVPI